MNGLLCGPPIPVKAPALFYGDCGSRPSKHENMRPNGHGDDIPVQQHRRWSVETPLERQRTES
ncbi:uncharacterized protein N7479_001198 [Penicillium vulpinum]|uniref:uncharacterized protein n=1 Tax=Penicillium vulpinum TaxID=29845 RepID=UPI0025486965|nr:uncharacterized protein N7479_001198 [Penicillium vulpinum]KAJ5971280.1 hypothetical protein N7479_001198 [Penicillium vulpinum]